MMRVAIRTDASLQIGTGHVMRCLTLADRLRDAGAEVVFISRAHAGHQCDFIAHRGYAVHRLPPPTGVVPPQAGAPAHAHWLGVDWQQDARETEAALDGSHPHWLVVDHYGLDRQWQQALRPHAARLMVLDDLADRPHDCDLLLDQNLSLAGAERYDALLPPAAQRLLGPAYALLREEFAAARATLAARDGVVRRLLVFIGGADENNDCSKVITALSDQVCEGVAVDIVAGAANPHFEALQAQARLLPGVTVHRQVGNMAELMRQADLAIGAGGGAMWERACLGLPAIVLAVARNQEAGSAAMARTGRAIYLGPAPQVTPELLGAALRTACATPGLLSHIGQQGMALVDGRGAQRVARHMLRLACAAIRLRPAGAADCEPLWAWRNAEAVRRFSGDGQPIALETHRAWFTATLANPSRQLLVGEIDGRAAGILRYDRADTTATISVYLTPDFMGKGIGAALIAAGSAWVAGHWPGVTTIEAAVKPENGASAAAFQAAGFAPLMNIYAQRIQD